MCGLAGFLGYSINTPNNKIISDCKNSLKRRGPDASGVFNKIKNKKSILLIHTRLSIVDLSKNSSQPFSDEKGSLIFSDDGEKIEIDPYPVDALDTVGAGDTFAGSFLYGINNGLDFENAGNLASKLSSKVVTKLGPRLDKEVIESIKLSNE